MVFLQYKMSGVLMMKWCVFTALFLHNVQMSPCKKVLQDKLTQTNEMLMTNKSIIAV